jgi:signal transduction histidine kinase
LQRTNENITFGVGIRNMHDRANLIGATFHIISTPGTGTQISLFLSPNH